MPEKAIHGEPEQVSIFLLATGPVPPFGCIDQRTLRIQVRSRGLIFVGRTDQRRAMMRRRGQMLRTRPQPVLIIDIHAEIAIEILTIQIGREPFLAPAGHRGIFPPPRPFNDWQAVYGLKVHQGLEPFVRIHGFSHLRKPPLVLISNIVYIFARD